MEILIGVVEATVVLVVIKSVTIGSEFNFYKWLKEGKEYTQNYFQTIT